MKVQNYGEWEGDRRGHHPPACTCYRCNEGRRRQQANQRKAEADSRRAAAAIREAEEAVRKRPSPSLRTRPNAPPANRSQQRESRAFRVSWLITATALRYALSLHTVTLAALVVYTVIQNGFTGVLPMLADAADAYVGAWASGIEAVWR